jgi:phosphate transport system substrate-binding protein
MRCLSKLVRFAAAVALSCGMAYNAFGEKLHMEGSTTVGPIAKAFAEYYMKQNPEVNITVGESGSGNGAKALINGACDVANMSRFMKEKEFKAAALGGTQPVAHVVALDGIAVVVHSSNPVRGLTMQQVQDIYAGKITNWSQVGGPNMPTVVISRDTNSGTYETFHKLVMGDEKLAAGVEHLGSNGAVRQKVMQTRGAIGYVGLGFVKDVKAVKVNGIMPSKATIVSGRYPIARPLFMFTNGYPKMGSHLYSLVTLHLSEDGQRIVEEKEFVPVTSY